MLLSPLIWCLAYRWPVHQIGPGHLPEQPPAEPTQLIVFRKRDDSVAFLEVNAVTLKLVQLLEAGESASSAFEQIGEELPMLDSKVIYEQGIATLSRLRDAQIILGVLSGETAS